MLDLKTILLIEFCNAFIQGLVWLIVWRGWNRFRELRFFALGYCAIGLGMLLLMLRQNPPPLWNVALTDVVIKFGVSLIAVGMARFLRQAYVIPLIWLFFAMQSAAWVVLALGTTQTLQLRLLITTIFSGGTILLMLVAVWRDISLPRALRLCTLLLFTEALTASLLFCVQILWSDIHRSFLADGPSMFGWYFIHGSLFLFVLFALLLCMFATRIASELQQQNDSFVREVAARRRLEVQLNTALATERALREEQLQFTRLASHELRNPLAIIQRSSEMIRELLPAPPLPVAERLGAIEGAVARMQGLLSRFLSADTRRPASFEPGPIRPAELLSQVLHHFRIQGRAGRLQLQSLPALPDLTGDAEMLRTVLINLIDNALKYAPPPTPVEISAALCGQRLCLRVRDHGIGIPPEEISQIGQRYFRASNAEATATGTGLGLYSCRRLLAYHDGTLELHQAPHGGIIAEMSLPLPGCDADQPAAPERKRA